jgi:hypothetical protein
MVSAAKAILDEKSWNKNIFPLLIICLLIDKQIVFNICFWFYFVCNVLYTIRHISSTYTNKQYDVYVAGEYT